MIFFQRWPPVYRLEPATTISWKSAESINLAMLSANAYNEMAGPINSCKASDA